MFLLSTADFFLKKIVFSFREHYQSQSVKHFVSKSGRTFVSPDLGPNCYQQRLSAVDTAACKESVKSIQLPSTSIIYM